MFWEELSRYNLLHANNRLQVNQVWLSDIDLSHLNFGVTVNSTFFEPFCAHNTSRSSASDERASCFAWSETDKTLRFSAV